MIGGEGFRRSGRGNFSAMAGAVKISGNGRRRKPFAIGCPRKEASGITNSTSLSTITYRKISSFTHSK
jgi:hypothetical protein